MWRPKLNSVGWPIEGLRDRLENGKPAHIKTGKGMYDNLKTSSIEKLIFLLGFVAPLSSIIAFAQPQNGIEITFGLVTERYRVGDPSQTKTLEFSHIGPVVSRNKSEKLDREQTLSLDHSLPRSAGEPADPDRADSVILYSVDFGQEGMSRFITAQASAVPGDCVAVEHIEGDINIRRINPEFCNSSNEDLAKKLSHIFLEGASRCQKAREELIKIEKQLLEEQQVAKVKMLCDG